MRVTIEPVQLAVTRRLIAQPVAPRRDLRSRLGLKSGAGVRYDLEGLRAIAVTGVVVYHLKPSWLPGGFAGVDVFFVLSGFFITGLVVSEIERTGSVDLLRFWGRRARRLLPASALVIIATITAGWFMTNPLEAQRIARDGFFSSIFGMNWRAAFDKTQYLQDPNPSPFLHYWSLGVEEQFYVVWPVLLFVLALLWRRTRSTAGLEPRRSLLALSVLIGFASFLTSLRQTADENSYAYFGTFERAWQLALGGALAVLVTRLARLPLWVRTVSRWAGIAMIVCFYAAASTNIVYPGLNSLLPATGAALVVAAGDATRDPVSRLLSSWPAQLSGRYSYSWYLWHYPPLVLLPIYLGHALRVRELALCVVVTLLAAVVTYHVLENPIRASRWLSTRRGTRSIALGAVLVLVAATGAQITEASAKYGANHSGITTTSGVPLDPQPGPAAKDYPRVYADGCVRGLNDDSTDLPVGSSAAPGCRYLPNTGHGDVVLTGDSHAAMWFPAVQRIAADHHWGLQFWARNSCPFADVTKDIGYPYTVCDSYRRKLLTRILADRPSLVIVASLDTAFPPVFLRDSAGRPTATRVRGPRAHQLFQDGYVRALQRLRRAGIKVLLIHDTPGYPANMTGPDCVLSHPKALSLCSLPQKLALPPGPDDLGAARRVGTVSTIDFTDVFCRKQRCYQVLGNTLAYRDQNHLTTPMTARLRPALEQAAMEARSGKVVAVRVKASDAR